MKTIVVKGFSCLVFAFCMAFVTQAQDSKDAMQKEYIIIEKVVDQDGNEISKKVTRKRASDISENELNELLKGNTGGLRDGLLTNPNDFFQMFERSFGENLRGTKPSIGLSLAFENNRAEISEVTPGSGAEDADIRAGDLLISINGWPISVYEDVKESMEGKEEGDQVTLVIVRDGSEIEKKVELKNNRFGNFEFNFPEGMGDNGYFFDFEGDNGFQFLTDSLLRKFDFDELYPNYNFGERPGRQETNKKDRPQLGIFIEDVESGVLITDVVENSPADKAGLQVGDIIVRMNDEGVTSFREISMIMNKKSIGEKLIVEVNRENKKRTIEVDLN